MRRHIAWAQLTQFYARSHVHLQRGLRVDFDRDIRVFGCQQHVPRMWCRLQLHG